MFEEVFEDEVVKNLIINETFFAKTFDKLKLKYFQKTENGFIFKSIKDFVKKYDKPPTPKEYIIFVKDYGFPNDIEDKVKSKIKQIIKDKEHVSDSILIKELKTYIQRLELKDAILESVDILENGENFDIIVGKIEEALNVEIDNDVGLDYLNSLKERFEYYTSKNTGLKTGLASLDFRTGGGFRPKTVNYYIAPSGGGKCHWKKTKLNIKVISEFKDKVKKYKKYKKYSKKYNIALKEFYKQEKKYIESNLKFTYNDIIKNVLIKHKMISNKRYKDENVI